MVLKYLSKELKHHKNMFCKIYTTGNDISEELVLNLLTDVLHSSIIDGYIEDENYSIYVDTNEEYDNNKEKNFPDGFLYFKLIIEIEFIESVGTEILLNTTNKILECLWKMTYPAVASCNYEEKLIITGGYNNTNLPWPH